MNKNPYDPDAILISFQRRMGRSVAGKHSGKHNLGQKTPIQHSRARQSVIKKQTSKVKQGMFCYYVTNLKRMIRTSSKTAGVYKVRYLCLVGKKIEVKDKDSPINSIAWREHALFSILFLLGVASLVFFLFFHRTTSKIFVHPLKISKINFLLKNTGNRKMPSRKTKHLLWIMNLVHLSPCYWSHTYDVVSRYSALPDTIESLGNYTVNFLSWKDLC